MVYLCDELLETVKNYINNLWYVYNITGENKH